MTHVLVTGGVRSGKSRHAETAARRRRTSHATSPPATPPTRPGTPSGPRGSQPTSSAARRAWRTVETLALAEAVAAAPGPVLIDCLGTWLTRLLDSWHAWDAEDADWSPATGT